MNIISEDFESLCAVLELLRKENIWKQKLMDFAFKVYHAFENSNKLLLIGNGGSAAQAQHIAAEFINRFLHERKALPAISLTTDTSNITSISNDYHYDRIFSRQIEAIGKAGDVLLCLSTSGNSCNLLEAIKTSKNIGIYTFSFLGKSGGKVRDLSDEHILIGSENTPRIQEMHIFLGHVLCKIVEEMTLYGG